MSLFFSNVCPTIDKGDDPNAFVLIDENRKVSSTNDAERIIELEKLSTHMSQTHSTNAIKVFWFIKCPYLKQNYLNNLRIGILQYVFVLYITTGIGFALQYKGKYCEEIFSIYFGQLYLVIIQTVSGLVANLCLNMLAKPVAKYLELIDINRGVTHLIELKSQLFWRGICVFAALFVITYQGHFINILVFFGLINSTEYWQPLNISKGIQAVLISIELFIIALIQIKAFPYRQYRPENRDRSSIVRSILDSMIPFDLIKECLYFILCCGEQ
ncbi:12330_t:CDS:2 [Dentiscutata heterogama]|uniref:12330_t:CDS:1 n=1 Tax=Dentiscutata heterogama TaxID=1316150 RepID=A0ACA9KKA6_9GLOM|nr:12330_t:CDS:2 [Dentiscutata heterogama]